MRGERGRGRGSGGPACVPGAAVSLVLALLALGPGALPAQAAAKPEIPAAWSTEVVATSARLRAEINSEGSRATYHFNYITQAAYKANLAAGREGFYGAAKAPAGSDPSIGEGSAAVAVFQTISSLTSATSYRYRVVAHNSEGTVTAEENGAGSPLLFTTQGLGSGALLADSRGWEMVSPLDKNGGQIQGPGQIAGGGVFQAALGGGAITYSSTASFGQGAAGAPYASQYISRRAESGWSSQNVSTLMLSGSYAEHPNGVPYQLFSEDLVRGLVLNGEHCRTEATTGCPIANPPPPGSGAPAGFQDYYLRNDEAATYAALLSEANKAPLALSSSEFDLALAGATPDLSHLILSTCAKLTADATEVAGTEGCDPAETNLYEWSGGTLSLLNEPATHHARLAAQSGAISTDGRRVYFTAGEDSPIFLREEGQPLKFIANTVGGTGAFQTATPDGALAFYAIGGELFRYQADTGTSDLLASGVKGVLGVSEDGSTVYYQGATGLEQWQEGTITDVAPGPEAAQPSDYPPTTGTARVSPDGARLLFLSEEELSGYDNTDATSGHPDSELFLYEAGSGAGGSLACLSCNPTAERPIGPSTIPGAYANGTQIATKPGQILAESYKPRVLSADGRRVFFESRDAIVLSDTNSSADVYEWEAPGEGSCAAAGGCLNLVSDGRTAGGASFLDASASGADAFFLTEGSLVPADPGSADVYDARIGGGFPEPPNPIPCNGDACQVLPPEPEDPEPGTLRENPGNPPLPHPHCREGQVLRHGRCLRKSHKGHPHKKHRRRRGRR